VTRDHCCWIATRNSCLWLRPAQGLWHRGSPAALTSRRDPSSSPIFAPVRELSLWLFTQTEAPSSWAQDANSSFSHHRQLCYTPEKYSMVERIWPNISGDVTPYWKHYNHRARKTRFHRKGQHDARCYIILRVAERVTCGRDGTTPPASIKSSQWQRTPGLPLHSSRNALSTVDDILETLATKQQPFILILEPSGCQ